MGSALVILLVLLAVTLTYGLFWNFFNIPKRAHYCRVCVDYWASRKSTELMANFTRFPNYRWNESWPNCQEPYQWVVDPIGCVRVEVHSSIPGEDRFTSQLFIPLSMMDDMPNGSIPVDKSHGNRTNFIYEVYWNTSSSLVPTTPASTIDPYFAPHILPIVFVVFLGLVSMKLVFISLLLFLPVVVSQDVCPSCVDELLLNLTANIEDTENSTMLSIAKLVVESEALLSKTCNASDLEFLNVEADVDCFQLTASGGIIPPGESAQLFGPITFLENTTLWDTISLLDRNDGFYNITAEGGTMIALRVADNILKYGSHRKTTRLYMFIQMILIIAGAILVLSGAIYFYSKRPELIPPYVRYEERIRVGLEPLPTIEEEPQMVLSEASPSNNVLLVSYSHINETVTITDEEGTPLEKSIVAPASEVEATAT